MTCTQKAALTTVASIPLIFGGQQLSEGFVWNDFENEAAVKCFAFTAYVFWPFYISLALFFTELTRPSLRQKNWPYWPLNLSDTFRRRVLLFNVFGGAIILVVGLVSMLPFQVENHVHNVNGRLHYEGWDIDSLTAGIVASLVYVYVIISGMVVSSLPYSTLLGELGFAALVVTFILWTKEFPSTWCFFSAMLSSIVVLTIWHELQLYREHQHIQEREQKGTLCATDENKHQKEMETV